MSLHYFGREDHSYSLIQLGFSQGSTERVEWRGEIQHFYFLNQTFLNLTRNSRININKN